MRINLKKKQGLLRRAVATVELAMLLPFLCCLFVAAVDFARVFYYGVVVANCARNGAYYASNYPNANYIYNNIYGYANLNDAITRDASDLNPTPTYTVYYSTSPTGPFTLTTPPVSGYVQVTVNWTFNMITSYPAVPNSINISRSCIMELAPIEPQF